MLEVHSHEVSHVDTTTTLGFLFLHSQLQKLDHLWQKRAPISGKSSSSTSPLIDKGMGAELRIGSDSISHSSIQIGSINVNSNVCSSSVLGHVLEGEFVVNVSRNLNSLVGGLFQLIIQP